MNNNILVKVKEKSNYEDNFGEIITDGYFSNSVSNRMKQEDDSMTDETINEIFNNASSILNHCPNPKYSEEFKKTGIVIGKVQSGKTSNFIALLALAFDNGYNIGILIGGNTTELLSQNVERIRKSFNVDPDKLVVLNSKDNNDLIEPRTIKNFINNGVKVLIVSLKSPQVKNQKHMSKISNLFDDYAMSNETTLIIDDEGDQATLNSKAYKNDKELEKSVSQTYKVALDIKNKIRRNCFISITATPQANLLIKTSDKLHPDFGTLIYPGKGYCGLSVFHGEEQDKYVKLIPDDEQSLLDLNSGIPNSFVISLASFYVSNAIRKARGDNKVHSMLIHPSIKKFDHEMVRKKVDELLNTWKKIANLGENDISYNGLRKILLSSYNMYKNDGVITRSFEEIEDQILDCIKKSSNVVVFNSNQINSKSNADLYSTRIYLGGNILDRGITIKGLAITYIIRRAKGFSTVDNTEQRARWFGYKNVPGHSDYIDICRVWATEAIKKDFASINESDEDMWTSIERNMRLGKSFKDLPRYFLLQYDASHKLKLTRPNVAKTEDVLWTEWKSQQKYIDNVNYISNNIELLNNFKLKRKEIIRDFGGINKHAYYYDVEFNEFINEVLLKYNFREDEKLDINLFVKLLEIIEKNDLNSKIDVVFLRIYDNEERTINDDRTVSNVYRGRDTVLNDNGEYNYNGDRSTCEEYPDKIQFQIHYIKEKEKETNIYSPFICFYIPEKYAYRLVKGEK